MASKKSKLKIKKRGFGVGCRVQRERVGGGTNIGGKEVQNELYVRCNSHI